MLPLRLETVIGAGGVAAWEALVASLPEGPLYHGTSLARARLIMAEGFRSSFGRIVDDEKVDAYWGRPCVAANFAYRNACADQTPPAIIQASLEDVLASGDPRPLRTTCDDCDEEYPSWRECHADTGSFWVKGGRHVRGLILHVVDVPVLVEPRPYDPVLDASYGYGAALLER